MDCQTVKQELVAFLDNEVSATTKAQIEAHLKGCPDCAQEMRALQASWQMLDRNLPPAPGPDFTASVMARIRQTPQFDDAFKPNGGEKFLPYLIAMAVIFVTFLMGLFIWDHLRSTTKAPFVQSPAPLVDPEVQEPKQAERPAAPVASDAVQTLPEIKPVLLPQAVPVVPVTVVPKIAKVDQDLDIIANLDMYENADLLKQMDVVADMDVVASMKETSS